MSSNRCFTSHLYLSVLRCVDRGLFGAEAREVAEEDGLSLAVVRELARLAVLEGRLRPELDPFFEEPAAPGDFALHPTVSSLSVRAGFSSSLARRGC